MYKHLKIIEDREDECRICNKQFRKLEDIEIKADCKHLIHADCLIKCIDTNAPKFAFNGCYVCQKIHDLPRIPETLQTQLPELQKNLTGADLTKIKMSKADELDEEAMLEMLMQTLGEEKTKMMLERIMNEMK